MTDQDRQLIECLFDDDLSPEEHQAATDLLDTDPAAVEYLADLSLLHSGLSRSIKRRALQHSAMASARLGQPRKLIALPSLRRASSWLAAAAAIVLGAFALWSNRSGVQTEVIAATNARLTDGSDTLEPGSEHRLRNLDLASGALHLRLPNDIQLDLLGPAELRFHTPMHVQLVRGRLNVDVGEKGHGFILDTPQTRLVDLGTAFGVDASSTGSTGVIVFNGVVEVHQKDGFVNRLTEGQGVRVDASGRLDQVNHCRYDPETGHWHTDALANRTELISSVRTNQPGREVYPIIDRGFFDDVPAHPRRPNRWRRLPTRPLPDWLLGADLVLPEPKHGECRDLNLTITLSRPATLFVFHRFNQPVPDWLQRDFTPTGERIGKTNVNPGTDQRPVGFDVWRRNITTPGDVQLGPATTPDCPNPEPLMYGVAAMPLLPETHRK